MKKVKLYVLIPDKSSGDHFNGKLHAHNIDTEYGYYYIHPRVINNKLTTSHDVVDDMNTIFQTFTDTTRSVVIACNTLQLWLPHIKADFKKHVKVYTTFEACLWRYPKVFHRPLWLGTYPLVERTNDFPTLLTRKKPDVQNMVQELIWRIKMACGDDTKTAFDVVKNDRKLSKKVQWQKISLLRNLIISEIKSLNIKQVILGCTELPMIFPKKKELGIEWIDPAEVLAEYVKHQSVIMLFAGGTISSMANKDGALVGGHVFNLLEKLTHNMPGSFRHLNITKSDIIYTGLSENMTQELLSDVWKHIEEALGAESERIVISHGTDAMEETATYVADRLRQSGMVTKTAIVFTGANFSPLSKHTDAWENLRFAINAKIPQTRHHQVFLAFHKQLIPAKEATKIYIRNQNEFISFNSSQYATYMTRYSQTVGKRVRALKAYFHREPDPTGILIYEVNRIRKNHDAFLSAVRNQVGKVVLFKLYHSGTANTVDPDASVEILVKTLTKKGIVCFGATETGEPTNLREYETSMKLLRAGLVPLYDMPYDVAYHKLMLLEIAKHAYSRKDLINAMLSNRVGEINEKRIYKKDIYQLIQTH